MFYLTVAGKLIYKHELVEVIIFFSFRQREKQIKTKTKQKQTKKRGECAVVGCRQLGF